MNKKILDAAGALILMSTLAVAANIQKESVRTCCAVEVAGWRHPTAGVSQTLSGYSFTTESDEKTVIERKENDRVTAGNEAFQEPIPETNIPEVTAEETGEPVQEIVETSESGSSINRWNLSLTDEEKDLVARIVWLEARGESQEGQEAVVEVIFNRIASDKFPNTVYEVLSQGNPTQFCTWSSRNTAQPTDKEYQSICEVLNGNTNILRNDTVYFSRGALTPNLDKQIGAHSFCY